MAVKTLNMKDGNLLAQKGIIFRDNADNFLPINMEYNTLVSLGLIAGISNDLKFGTATVGTGFANETIIHCMETEMDDYVLPSSAGTGSRR